MSVESHSIEEMAPRERIVRAALRLFAEHGREEQGPSCTVYAPMIRERKGEYRRELTRWLAQGQAGPRDPRDEYLASFPEIHEVLTGSYTPEAAYLAALTGLAMRKAAADFVLNFEGNPVVRARLRK